MHACKYGNFKYNGKLFSSSLASNSCELIDWLFFDVPENQTLFDYALLLTSMSTSFQEPRIGHINKYSFLSELKNKKSDASQFF